MAVIIYGTRVFTKFKGYYGERRECEVCHRVYQPGYVKVTQWAHLEYIPLFPYKKRYFKMCPICGRGYELKSREAKPEMQNMNGVQQQNLQVFAKHVLANKPKGLMKSDTSYEAWVKDLFTGEEICIATDLTKANIKEMKKERGLKKLPIQTIE